MIQNNEEKEGIDVSPVTIDSALKNRNKAWNVVHEEIVVIFLILRCLAISNISHFKMFGSSPLFKQKALWHICHSAMF
jgi:hypothetical protein